jgi:hypothetical protein
MSFAGSASPSRPPSSAAFHGADRSARFYHPYASPEVSNVVGSLFFFRVWIFELLWMLVVRSWNFRGWPYRSPGQLRISISEHRSAEVPGRPDTVRGFSAHIGTTLRAIRSILAAKVASARLVFAPQSSLTLPSPRERRWYLIKRGSPSVRAQSKIIPSPLTWRGQGEGWG